MLLIGFAAGPLFVGSAGAALVRAAGWDGAPVLYAPFAQQMTPYSASFRAYPLEPWIHRLPLIVSIAALIVAAALAWLVPARESAGGESLLLTLGQALAVSSAGVIALDPAAWREFRGDALLPRIVIGGLTALLVVAIERRSVALLRTFRSLATVGSRVGWWALRIPLAYAIFAAAGVVSGFVPVALAAACAVLLTLLQTIAMRVTKDREVVVTEHAIGFAAAVSTVVAIAFVAGSLWLFGHPLTGQPRAVVVQAGWPPAFESVGAFDKRIHARYDALLEQQEAEKPIKIQWSRERKQKASEDRPATSADAPKKNEQ